MAGPNAHLTLSSRGAYKIKEWESGSAEKPRLRAYDDGTGTWTIGFGATKGIKRGMKINVARAHELFDEEIGPFIDAVHRLIKAPVSQGLFDALVSFFYNNGWGKAPTLIRSVNSGNEAKIRAAFMLYVMAYDARLGKKTRWPGLVNRRQKELAHWAEMDSDDFVVASPPMPARLPPAEAPSSVSVALKSKSVWSLVNAQVLLVAGYLTNWGANAVNSASEFFGAVPSIATETFGVVSSTEKLSKAAGLDWQSVSFSIVVACVLVATIRHIRDKRLLS